MYLKHCEIVQDADKLKVDIQATCMKYKSIKKWAYILHDKDDTRPHYHIYLNFGSSGISTADIALWFQLAFINDDGEECTGENFVSRIKGRATDMLLYLTHGQPDQKFKYQYLPNEVHANFDFMKEIEEAEIIGDFENHSYAQMLSYIKTLPKDQQIPSYNKLEKLWRIHCKWLCLQPNRNIEVIFIYGEPGTGKTTYAKRMLEKLNKDYAVSSSNNDPLQDYMGQRAFILDDLRDNTFEFNDLLKMLDNNTRTSVKSRFENKVFNGDMIVITSPVPIDKWYKFGRDRFYDKLNQFYRRISTYIITTEKSIEIYDGVSNNGLLKKMVNKLPNMLIKELKKKQNPKTNLGELFESIVFDDEEDSSGGATQESILGLVTPVVDKQEQEASEKETEDEEDI